MHSKGSLTRQNIIENSPQLFSVKGFYNTSISDIQEATGLTKGGLYGHFASKEDIWYAVYEEAVTIWKRIVFNAIRSNSDPLTRIEKFIENDLRDYLGSDVFDGGCFFLNMLVELSGQSAVLSSHLMKGFDQLAGLLCAWLQQAEQQGLLKEYLDLNAIARYIIIALNGAAALHACNRDPAILDQTVNQLHFYIEQLRK